jgi:glycine/D-amino acid oxidase-like deaminating enzyme
VTLETRRPERSIETIPCNAIVIAAGPWSPRVLSQLFPALRLKLRMNSITSAGNHALVRNLHWRPSDDEKSVTQVFLNNVLPGSHSLDITSFLGGTLYIGGWGARPEQVPEYADDIRPQPDQIEAMLEVTRSFLRAQPGENLEVLNTGRCYRPLAIPNKPIIGKVDWCQLYENEPPTAKLHPKHHTDRPLPTILGGLYVNTGHNSDGVTLGPGSGNIMSEYLLGRTSTVQVSLEPLDYDEKTSRGQHYL